LYPGSGILSQDNPWTIAILITIGGLVIILFIDNTTVSSALEAAGAFIVLLTGFYDFSQIFLLGAILTRIKARLTAPARN
jgi:uncharacterized BrkB/YihY/UPF0761 family membrane protein